jgi:methionyl aminopeptidase
VSESAASRRAPLLTPGQYQVTPTLSVPDHILRPPYAATGQPPPPKNSSIESLSDSEIVGMRKAAALAAYVRSYAGSMVSVGITTDEIDRAVHDKIISYDAYPSPLNYLGFPKALCSSVNEVVCHGVPDTRPLQNGDIVNLDVSVYVEGFHGDCSATFYVGEVDDATRQLVEVTKKSMDDSIAMCEEGMPLNKIGHKIADVVEPYNYGIVRTFCGHGISSDFHCPPMVYHYRNDEPGHLVRNMAFTIEPMINEGTGAEKRWPDGWTVVTADGGRSAQFEETLIINGQGKIEIISDPEAFQQI